MAVQDIRPMVRRLVQVIGVRGAVADRHLRRLFKKGDYTALCIAIGQQLGLRNLVRLRTATASDRFTTRSLSTTDAFGRGTEGVVAQVRIPRNLPLYGTSAFDAHVVEMLLGETFHNASFDTAVTLLAHELSHVLLHSVRHVDRDSEHATDLVPILLGFAAIVQRGRRVSTSEQRGDTVHTLTTTYGYLSDEDLGFATSEMARLVKERRQRIVAVGVAANATLRRAVDVIAGHNERHALLERLDAARAVVRPRDASAIVAMHAPGYQDDAPRQLRLIERRATAARIFAAGIVTYTDQAMGDADRHLTDCMNAARELDRLWPMVRHDIRVLAGNQPVRARLAHYRRNLTRRMNATLSGPVQRLRMVSVLRRT